MEDDHHACVAIVDDDPWVLDSLKFLLETAGHKVRGYASAADFLRDRAERAACLILDHHMPQMTGLELASWLRAAGKAIPVLLVTGSPSPAIVARAAQLGIAVLEKPPAEADLLRFVNAHR